MKNRVKLTETQLKKAIIKIIKEELMNELEDTTIQNALLKTKYNDRMGQHNRISKLHADKFFNRFIGKKLDVGTITGVDLDIQDKKEGRNNNRLTEKDYDKSFIITIRTDKGEDIKCTYTQQNDNLALDGIAVASDPMARRDAILLSKMVSTYNPETKYQINQIHRNFRLSDNMQKIIEVSNKQKNQPYNTRVSFDDKVYTSRNKTSVPPLSQGATDGAVKYKSIKEDSTSVDAEAMVDNAINVVERHLEHYKNSPNKEILNREELFNATEALEDERIFNKFHEDDLETFFLYAEAGRDLLNNEVNENKKNMKQIRISESTLKGAIRKAVKGHLKEYRQEYSSMGRTSKYTVELESEDVLEYTIVAKVSIIGEGEEVYIDNIDLVEGSYDPSEIEQIEDELTRDYNRNMERIQERALEMQENDRHESESKGW